MKFFLYYFVSPARSVIFCASCIFGIFEYNVNNRTKQLTFTRFYGIIKVKHTVCQSEGGIQLVQYATRFDSG